MYWFSFLLLETRAVTDATRPGKHQIIKIGRFTWPHQNKVTATETRISVKICWKKTTKWKMWSTNGETKYFYNDWCMCAWHLTLHTKFYELYFHIYACIVHLLSIHLRSICLIRYDTENGADDIHRYHIIFSSETCTH